jgi:S1-C subfamily serine protease
MFKVSKHVCLDIVLFAAFIGLALLSPLGAQLPPVVPKTTDTASALSRVQATNAAVNAARKAHQDALAALQAAIQAEFGPNAAGPSLMGPVAAAVPQVERDWSSAVAAVIGTNDGKPSGNAVLVAPDRLLTCANVVGDGKSFRVRFPGGAEVLAEVLSTDPKRDLAVLKVPAGGRKPLERGTLATGAVTVQASPYGYGEASQAGSIVAVGQTVTATGGSAIADVALTDVPLVSGSSGAAVLNARGELVGLACVWRDGGRLLRFVIPASHAAGLLKE